MVADIKVDYFSVFIKLKTLYNIKHIFKNIETPIRVTFRFNYSMVLTTRGSYISRTHLVYSVK